MIVSAESVFSGTEGTFFRVEMLSDAGTSWKWSKKVLIGGWDAYTTVTDYDLDTAIELALGVKVEFIQSAKSDYNDGDYWIWIMTADMKLDPDITGSYSDLKVVENGNKKNLFILNKNSGSVVEIKDFESTSPSINENVKNIGASDSIDICSKNKEIYIARGENKIPKWIGYTKNNSFSPPSDSASIMSDDAYHVIDVESTFTKMLDDFVTLRGIKSASDVILQKHSKIVAGIKYGEDRLYVCYIRELVDNPPVGTIYSYKLSHNPIRVRLDYSTFHPTGQKYIAGVAVMTEPSTGYQNNIEFWKVHLNADPGKIVTKEKTINLVKPANFNIEGNKGFSDFLIVPTNIDYTNGSCAFHGVFSYEMSVEETQDGLKGQKCLYRVEGINTLSDGSSIPSTVLTASGTNGKYIGFTPKLDFRGTTLDEVVFADVKQASSSNYAMKDGALLQIMETGDINLAIGGYDSAGLYPWIHFTVNLKPPHDLGTYSGSASGNPEEYGQPDYGPFWIDNTGKLWAVCTVTFVPALSVETDDIECATLVHFKHTNLSNPDVGWTELTNHYGTEDPREQNYIKEKLANDELPPAVYPLFALPGEGRKYNIYGDVDNHNGARRALSYYNITNKQVCTFNVPAQDGASSSTLLERWDTRNIWVFPNPNGTVYSRFTSASSGTTQNRPVTSLYTLSATGNWHDKKRYRLGDNELEGKFRDTNVSEGANFGQIGLPWEDEMAQVIMAPITGMGETVEHWYQATMNAGGEKNETHAIEKTFTEAVDEISGAATWLSFSDPEDYTALSWNGSDTKKSFYKISLIYDGYQESSLLNSIITHDKATAFVDGIEFDIRIDAGYSFFPKRVNAIAVYRGDSALQASDNPDSLYRFIKEIPLTDFAYDEANTRYAYTVLDDGDAEGSYSAINGIPETMSSLSINYTYCTEQNGYMFIGKCNHKEFGDANNVIFRSQPGKYSIFNWSTDFAQIPFTTTAMIGFMGKVYVFGYTEMAIINPETLVIEDTIKGIGCIGPKAIHITSTGLYWFDESNIYSASPRITKIGQSILSVDTYGWYNLSSDVKKGAVTGFDVDRQAYLVFFTTGSDKRCWAYSTMMNRWDLWETDATVMDTEQSSDGSCILLLKDGRICKYLAGPNRRSWEWQSKKITFGSDTIFKKVRVAKIDASNRENTSIKYQTDISTEASGWQAGTNNSNNYGSTWLGNSIKIDSAHSKARWAKFQLKGTNDSAGSDYKGYSLGVIFKPKRPK